MKTETPITLEQTELAVGEFESMKFFNTIGDGGRVAIMKSLLRLVNAPCQAHPTGLTSEGVPCECERPILRNDYGTAITKPPAERLRVFVEAFLRVPGGWPGIAEMEALYGNIFPPGDGIDRGSPQTPGYTWADQEAGTHTPMLPPEPERPLIGPGDEPFDSKAFIEEASKNMGLTKYSESGVTK